MRLLILGILGVMVIMAVIIVGVITTIGMAAMRHVPEVIITTAIGILLKIRHFQVMVIPIVILL
jgi:hypothetical protein